MLHIEGITRSYIFFTTVFAGRSKINLMAEQRIHSWKMNALTMEKPSPRNHAPEFQGEENLAN